MRKSIFTLDQKREIGQKYLDGMSSIKLAIEYNCSDTTIRNILRELNIGRRTAKEFQMGRIPWNKDKNKISSEEKKEIIKEYNADINLSLRKLALKYNRSYELIRRVFLENNQKLRTSGESHKGKPSPRKGKKCPEISKKMMGENNPMYGKLPWNKGMSPSKETKDRISKSLTGRFVGEKSPSYGKKRPDVTGENSPFWKGGITPLSKQIRNSVKYSIWRLTIFERDNFICQECGDKRERGHPVRIEVHHLKPFSKILGENHITTFEQSEQCEELWDINNGIVLCKKCHEETKKVSKKIYENDNTF